MINKDTILSVYDDKLTLQEWLAEVKDALENAVLTSAEIVDEGTNYYHFVFTFEDDSTITTSSFEMPKAIASANITDGELHIILTDGTDVNAGSITATFGATTFYGNVQVTDGNLTAGGNLEVDGTLSVNSDTTLEGDLNANGITNVGTLNATGEISAEGAVSSETYLECDAYVRPLTEAMQLDESLSFSTSQLNASITFENIYSKVRVSNGKLNIVAFVGFSNESGSDVSFYTSGAVVGSITDLDSSIMNLIYPYGDTNTIGTRLYNEFSFDETYGYNSTGTLVCCTSRLVKSSTGIQLHLRLVSPTSYGASYVFKAGAKYLFRVEYNITL